ncbi:MAG: ABC transporter substrate-binding protein/permease [Alphaproteobacteria bacterium]|nr:ABC transporter substrate-binding protein/permease [Alphaproteobacteria bacterium]MBU0798533.1 ABC transporter substrate-binding protein/permease [Alphaproteobacteria bacterium]MBU0886187.1 ABC transporter substrate-binding protein/permease [Alphaproteobacteria bacterium]MBU1812827.1 ABC transporter substrate-binding protein/permease [Alphaproteobacteria bacterium]
MIERLQAGSSFLLLLIALLVGASPVQADELDHLRSKGKAVIGVKADYPPWGFRDPEGKLIGMEIDLANDLGRRLGVPVEIVAVQSANRLEALRQGQIDILIATTGDSASRRRIVGMVEPHYYASGVNILASRTLQLMSWEQMKGAPICAKQGTYFNKAIARRYDLDLRIFKETRQAKLALKDRRCIGFLFDDSAIAADLLTPEWQAYTMPLPTLDETGWAVGLRQVAMGGPLERLVSDAVADWHRSGLLLELEAKWGIKQTAFLASMNRLWSASDANGNAVCRRGADGSFPAECRPTRLETQQTTVRTPGQLEKWVKSLGLNLTILYDPYDREQFLRGLANTILLALGCIVLSVTIGIVGAWLLGLRFAPVRWLATAYVEFFRYTPPLVQLYFFFFGIGAMMPLVQASNGVETPLLGGFTWAVIALGVYAGASNTVIFRTGIDAVPRDIHDSTEALGYSPLKAYALIILPLALRNCLAALNANLVNIVKATGLASAIAVPELLYVTNQIWPEEGNTVEMMNVLLITFFLLVSVLVYAMHRLERRLRIPGAA